jgi:tetratricopeptide (TPR) repeat protein
MTSRIALSLTFALSLLLNTAAYAAGPAATPAPAAAAAAPAAAVEKDAVSDPAKRAERDAALNNGIALFKKNKQDEAIVEFQKALAIDQYNVAIMNWLGVSQQRMNKWEDARATYEKAVDLDEKSPELHNNLAYTYQQLNQLDKAEAEYKKALDLKPAKSVSDAAQFNLASVLLLEKKYSDAIPAFEAHLKNKPDDANAIFQIGMCALQTKDYPKAKQYFEQSLKTDPKNAAALCGLGMVEYDGGGDKAKAEEYFQKSLDLNPQFYNALLYLGKKNIDEKRFNEALGFLGKGLEVNPYDAEVHFLLGKLYFSLESYTRSIKQFQDALKCDPQFPEAQAWLDKTVEKKKAL